MSQKEKAKKTDSTSSIGFAPSEAKGQSKEGRNETVIETEVFQRVSDICNVLVFCQNHQKICVSALPSKGLWMPSTRVEMSDSWTHSVHSLLELIGFEFNKRKTTSTPLIDIFRIQLSQTCNFVTRMTFFIEVKNFAAKKSKCCEFNDKYQWIGVKQIVDNDSDFWGPEVKQMVSRFVLHQKEVNNSKQSNEFDTKEALKDYCDQPVLCTTHEQMMIRSATFVEKDIMKLYDIYVNHCYPSQYMPFQSFVKFAKRIGLRIVDKNLMTTFRAIDRNKNNFLSFNDLVLGMAAMDQAVEHGGDFGKLRCAYILRYYDEDSDGLLSETEMCKMVSDIQDKSTPNSIFRTTFDKQKTSIETYAKQVINNYGSNGKISLDQLTDAVGKLQLRGTSVLFRASGQTIRHLSMKYSSQQKTNKFSVNLVKNNRFHNNCENCRKRVYSISKHLYSMTKSGEVLSMADLKDKWGTSIQFKNEVKFDSKVFDLAIDVINKVNRLYVKRMAQTDKQSPIPSDEEKKWFYSSKEVLINKLKSLCHKTQQLIAKEERVLTVSTPCYIFGDIHGNLKDLMIFSEAFWRSSPLLNESNYLFLGDYVDRGDFGVECVAYLFALKLIAPNKFWLCRGNHEVRELQEAFTFRNECVEKYSKDVWDVINDVFDVLPIAAIVDNKIFCSHGGIPTTTSSIQVLRTAPTPLPDPQLKAPQVWEVLWNDPMPDEEFKQLTDFQRQGIKDSKGFQLNVKRGTGYYYSEVAVNDFLKHNKLQFIIRGHECVPNGYKFLMNGTVTTIFSTSLYCGQTNEASVMFVNQNKIRVIRVHTFN